MVRERLRQLAKNDWIIALLLLALFLLTHGYRYGWDDQYAEIPVLKSLIDNTLYANDYFITSLRKSFPTHFYSLLSRFITVDRVPAAYFILYVVSRYFMFFFIYKLWFCISKKRGTAFLCSATFIVLTRVLFFLYLTFSHAEFTYPFIFAGLYFFYKKKYIAAAVVLGAATNFHALYGIFAMFYMSLFLLLTIKKCGFRVLLKAVASFCIFALPFIIHTFTTKHGILSTTIDAAQSHANWLSLCRTFMPERFFFPANFRNVTPAHIAKNSFLFLIVLQDYLYLISLYVLNCFYNNIFKNEIKNHVIVISSFILLAICYVGSYITPNKVILILDFIRTRHFLLFLLPGYTALLVINMMRDEKPWVGFVVGVLFFGTTTKGIFGALFSCMMIFFIFFLKTFNAKENFSIKDRRLIFKLILFILSIAACVSVIVRLKVNPFANTLFLIAISALALVFILRHFNILKKDYIVNLSLCVVIPMFVLSVAYMNAHYKVYFSKKNDFVRLREDWEDVQRQAKEKTPKDAIILVPYDMPMGGFRVFSERSIVVSENDIGGFLIYDSPNVYEWSQRMIDIEPFKLLSTDDLRPAIANAIVKYGADHIVFTTKNSPKQNNTLRMLYINRSFVLYKIIKSS